MDGMGKPGMHCDQPTVEQSRRAELHFLRAEELLSVLTQSADARAIVRSAIRELDRAIELRPDVGRYYDARGLAYFRLGEFEAAIQDFSQVLELGEDARAYYNRAVARQKIVEMRDDLAPQEVDMLLGQAIEDYNKAIELSPQDADVLYNRGNAHLGRQEYQEAIDDYTRAIALNPDEAEPYFNRAVAFEHIGGSRYSDEGGLKQAISDYTLAIERSPNYFDAYFNRAVCLEHVAGQRYSVPEMTRLAVEDYTVAIRLRPREAKVFLNRAWAYRSLGEHQKAKLDAKRSLQLTSDEFLKEQALALYEALDESTSATPNRKI